MTGAESSGATRRPLVSLADDEKIVITVLRDAVARGDGPLTVDQVQRLTWWPTRTGAGRELGRHRVSRALRSLTVRGLAIRTRPDVNHYRLDEQAWLAWRGSEIRRVGAGW